jgi:SulP family sulfate permease
VDKLEELVSANANPSKALILELHQLINIDATDMDTLDNVRKILQNRGSRLIPTLLCTHCYPLYWS